MNNATTARRTYYLVFVALLALLGLTIGATYVDLGPLNAVIAITIAVTKALLVILFFMHARRSDYLVWIYLGIGVGWFFILVALTMGDYLTRGTLPPPV
jgi:cytochrome c oxidase subunit 4